MGVDRTVSLPQITVARAFPLNMGFDRMTFSKEFRTGMKVVPGSLPCGCKLKNKQGAAISSNAIVLKDGTRICKCGKRWGFFIEVRKFGEIGLYAALKGVRLSGSSHKEGN